MGVSSKQLDFLMAVFWDMLCKTPLLFLLLSHSNGEYLRYFNHTGLIWKTVKKKKYLIAVLSSYSAALSSKECAVIATRPVTAIWVLMPRVFVKGSHCVRLRKHAPGRLHPFLLTRLNAFLPKISRELGSGLAGSPW